MEVKKLMLVITIPVILWSLTATAFTGTLDVDHYCSFNDVQLPTRLTTFSSDSEAEDAISRIMQTMTLRPKFKIMAADIPNAAAVIKNKQRYVLYNQLFMSEIRELTGSEWGAISILAHEIGHHLNSDTLEGTGSRPQIELEADMFSGSVLYDLGASLNESVAAMRKIASIKGSRTHPPRRTRLAAITNGWKQAQQRRAGRPPVKPKAKSNDFVREVSGSPKHSHNGRTHSHSLPASGLTHQHGGSRSSPVISKPTSESKPSSPQSIQLGNNLKLLQIPAGRFLMGSNNGAEVEKPAHTVTIPKPFYMSKTEVTFNQYDAYTKATGESLADDEKYGRGTNPVINVSWNDTQGYVKWLTVNNSRGLHCRLPSESEWEYAARGGGRSKYFWGDVIGKNNANCDGCGSQWGQWDGKALAPVGSFRENSFGLQDMHGNVWEWVQDPWHKNYQGSPNNGAVWEKDGDVSRHVMRGGSWSVLPFNLRSASRGDYSKIGKDYDVGFRIVCSLKQ